MDENPQLPHGSNSNVGSTNDISVNNESESVSNLNDIKNDKISTKTSERLSEFKKDLKIKREKRELGLNQLKYEIAQLKLELQKEKELNKTLKCKSIDTMSDNVENIGIQTGSDIKTNGSCGVANQCENANQMISPNPLNVELPESAVDIITLQIQLGATQKQVRNLQEVIQLSKEMLEIRENQILQLKQNLNKIEETTRKPDMKCMTEKLRQEYEHQLDGMRNLKSLYQERNRIHLTERQNLTDKLDATQTNLESEISKNVCLLNQVDTLTKDALNMATTLSKIKEELLETKCKNKIISEEMEVVNQLFGQILGCTSTGDLKFDQLIYMLEHHRDLLNYISNHETGSGSSTTIQKLLLDMISQSKNVMNTMGNKSAEEDVVNHRSEMLTYNRSPEEIVENLPKVWKLLKELLSHQLIRNGCSTENADNEECYNTIETSTGPQLVLSVSKTYIRLKDLILAKNYHQQEISKLKELNTHIESRTDEHEKRLVTVIVDLNKTWKLVSRMHRQHRQLHTNEQILRYHLQQKRRMLNDLKEELEHCRRKWALAREKNNESQFQLNSLRSEVENRKETDSNNVTNCADTSKQLDIHDHDHTESEPLVVPTPISVLSVSKNTPNNNKPEIISNKILIHRQPLCAEIRNENIRKVSLVSTSGDLETLEEMFYRISGLQNVVSDDKLISTQEEKIFTIASTSIDYNELPSNDVSSIEILSQDSPRDSRLKSLEEQCQELITKIITRSQRGDELISKLDCVQQRYHITEVRPEPDIEPVIGTDYLTAHEQQYVDRRAARLTRLEEECKAFLDKVNKSNRRVNEIDSQLNRLHTQYQDKRINTDNTIACASSSQDIAIVTPSMIEHSVSDNYNMQTENGELNLVAFNATSCDEAVRHLDTHSILLEENTQDINEPLIDNTAKITKSEADNSNDLS